ncbi:MAG: serine/threonine protein kinase, partial [Acidimicrobiia bacterium]|nr:serine/threonine protein kinase [Acidimicrobiia bacterium]
MAYETIRRLGRGGMGVVDLARDDNGREVALKRLSLHGTPEELAKARQRIRREAEVLRKLDHPAIVALLDVFDDGDDIVLVMDYLPGGNLAQRVNADGPLPSAQIGEIGDRLLDGLASAHRQGIVHRDIKPANVLFDADGRAALADFGVAIHRDATPGLTASEMVVGTPGFMSPEQARGETATSASDVFCLGATLAFGATGEGPFGTADPRVLMLRAAAGRTERLPKTVSPDLRRRLDAMLHKDPARRPSAAAARGGPDGTHPRT